MEEYEELINYKQSYIKIDKENSEIKKDIYDIGKEIKYIMGESKIMHNKILSSSINKCGEICLKHY